MPKHNFYIQRIYFFTAHLAYGPHVLQILLILGQIIVSVHLQHKLQVQIFPVGCVVNQVSIDTNPWLIICLKKYILLKFEEYYRNCFEEYGNIWKSFETFKTMKKRKMKIQNLFLLFVLWLYRVIYGINLPGSPMSWGTTPLVLTGEQWPLIRFNLSVGSCCTTLPAKRASINLKWIKNPRSIHFNIIFKCLAHQYHTADSEPTWATAW